MALEELDALGVHDVAELLGGYAAELRATGQGDEADRILGLAADPSEHFLMSVPEAGADRPVDLDGVAALSCATRLPARRGARSA